MNGIVDATKLRLPLVGSAAATDADIDAELAQFEAAERSRLGLEGTTQHWVETMSNLSFSKAERPNITLLVGGLTMAHDFLVQGALEGVGYNVVALDCPDEDAFRTGKEFGNKSQCNPTYFTVGNLVKYLIQLRDEKGLSTREIIDRYVFLTAGACGPCRFGMYVTEYRKALRDAGFDGFRVMLFQQQGGLDQATGEEVGLELKPKFFIALLKALVAGDVLNALVYRIRPYELEPGATDRVMERSKRVCQDALRKGKSILGALYAARREFARIQVDRTVAKPRVAIIGEFWAMTTEGDGNYRLQRFIEKEGGECDVQLVTAWLLYNVWEVKFDTRARASLRGTDGSPRGLANLGRYDVVKREASLWAADRALRSVFQTFAHAVGLNDYHLPDMDQIAELAHEHYDNDLRGGEGHMEVGKLILNVAKQKATMTLSVKPFGCMPSSGVSDGVQSLITEKYPGTIFCAVETSGDGAVNFQSRVQMYLFKAKAAAEEELRAALESYGLTRDDVRAFLRANPALANALHRAPHAAAHTAADVVHEVGRAIERRARQRAKLAEVLAMPSRVLRRVRGQEPAVAAE
jgi:predicted nucleotide-binding protein (sugar kinase/HSP70/actin superfamily)